MVKKGGKCNLLTPTLNIFFLVSFLFLAFHTDESYSCSSKAKQRRGEEIVKENLTCRDESGQPLKWFIVYKIAKLKDSSHNLIKNGFGYAYLKSGSENWLFSQRSIGDSHSVVGQSLRTLYNVSNKESASQSLYILFNDQPPKSPTVSSNGHSKGVIIANEKGGIWLQHSVPKFPNDEVKYEYPSSGTQNAQMFICMTLDKDTMENVAADALLHIKPAVYNHFIPDHLKLLYPNMIRLASKGRKRHRDPSKIFYLTTGDLNVTIFSKGPKFEQEIYSDWIAPTLDSSLKVQSWLNGPNAISSNCESKKYKIMNIAEKQLDKNKFSTHKDHSKWAISSDKGSWTCISDLNRMERQKTRGGVSICITNEKIWHSFDKSVIDLQPCGRPNNTNTS